MADEPENLTLALLREMRAEMHAEQERSAEIMGKIADAVTQIAMTQDYHSQVLTRHSELLEQIAEQQRSHGGRLNVIDGRLAIIEKHTGLVKA